MPGVGLMLRVVGFRSLDPEVKSRSAVELIPGGVNSACHPSEVGKMTASMLVYCVGVTTRPGLCPIAKETAEAAPTLCTEYGPNLLLFLRKQAQPCNHLKLPVQLERDGDMTCWAPRFVLGNGCPTSRCTHGGLCIST